MDADGITLDDGILNLRLHSAQRRTNGVYSTVDVGDYVISMAAQPTSVVILAAENIPLFLDDVAAVSESKETTCVGQRYVSYIGTQGATEKALRHTYMMTYPSELDVPTERTVGGMSTPKDATCAVCDDNISEAKDVLLVYERAIHGGCIDAIEPVFDEVWTHTDTMLSETL